MKRDSILGVIVLNLSWPNSKVGHLNAYYVYTTRVFASFFYWLSWLQNDAKTKKKSFNNQGKQWKMMPKPENLCYKIRSV